MIEAKMVLKMVISVVFEATDADDLTDQVAGFVELIKRAGLPISLMEDAQYVVNGKSVPFSNLQQEGGAA